MEENSKKIQPKKTKSLMGITMKILLFSLFISLLPISAQNLLTQSSVNNVVVNDANNYITFTNTAWATTEADLYKRNAELSSKRNELLRKEQVNKDDIERYKKHSAGDPAGVLTKRLEEENKNIKMEMEKIDLEIEKITLERRKNTLEKQRISSEKHNNIANIKENEKKIKEKEKEIKKVEEKIKEKEKEIEENVEGSDWFGINKTIETFFENLLSKIIRAVLFVIHLIIQLVYGIIYYMVVFFEALIDFVLDPKFITEDLGGFTTAKFVKGTAQIVANLCNMVYLFILLFIAMATIVSISGFDYKKLLVKLVFAALLTNFSLVISGIVVDFSQVIMYTIVDGVKERKLADTHEPDYSWEENTFTLGTDILDSLRRNLQDKNKKDSEKDEKTESDAVSTESSVANLFEKYNNDKFSLYELLSHLLYFIMLTIFAFILAITLFVIAGILMIRIVVLWILLILSPAAFLFSVMDSTKKHWTTWWTKLTQYAFIGPILVFFLWLTDYIARVTKFDRIEPGKEFEAGTNITVPFGEKLAEFFRDNLPDLFKLIILTIVLWSGILIASSFSIKGVGTLKSWGSGMGKGLLKGIGRVPTALKMLGLGYLGYKIGKKEDEAEMLEKKGGATNLLAAKVRRDEIEKMKKNKERTSKFFAVTSPTAWKRATANYLKSADKNYWGDMDKALHEFSPAVKRAKRHQINLAKEGTKRDIGNAGEALEELGPKWKEEYDQINRRRDQIRNDPTSNDVPMLEEEIRGHEKDLKKYEDAMTPLIEFISEKTGFDKKQKNEIQEEFWETFKQDSMPENLVDHVGINIKGGKIRPVGYLLDRAGTLAGREKEKEISWIEGKKGATEKEKEIREKLEELKKAGVPSEEVRRRVEKLEGSQKDLVAGIRRLGESDREMGRFVNELVSKFGNIKDVIQHLKDQYPEDEVINALRASDKAAEQTHNLYMTGRTKYNPLKRKMDFANEAQREEAIISKVKKWTPHDIGKIDPQMFEFNDEAAIKSFAKGVKWEGTENINWGNFRGQTIQSSRQALIANEGRLRTDVDLNQQAYFDNFMNKLKEGST